MKKHYIKASLTLLAAIVTILAGMYVYSCPENETKEARAVKNIIIDSVTLDNRSGTGCYILRDTAGTEYVFSRLPDSLRGKDISGSSAEIRYSLSGGVKKLRELSINGEKMLSEKVQSRPALAHIAGAVIMTAGFVLLWVFVNIVTKRSK